MGLDFTLNWDWDINSDLTGHLGGDLGVSANWGKDLLLGDGISGSWSKVVICRGNYRCDLCKKNITTLMA